MRLPLLLSSLLAYATASPLQQTWDYIIVGSGAGGIPLADRLSESGKSVLLIERGPASSGRYGGTRRPAWLEGTNLTRFDVPALYQFIWTNLTDNSGILCPDVSMTASCVLGGGTAINAALFWLPTPTDWDDTSMPPGWHSANVNSAEQKARSRLPWTEKPSSDGKPYLTNGTQIATDLLTDSSLPHPYSLVHANEVLNTRDHILSLAEFYFLNGERGGPMATYLLTASQRKNFHLQLNTTVTRVVRTGKHVEGVQVEATSPGSLNGTIKLTPGTGRVILSAGVFGTSKILFRSGIGPLDQLQTVQNSTDGPYLIDEKNWIDRPVGKMLDDAPAIYIPVPVQNLEIYPWENIWSNPIPSDVQNYLQHRAGPLTEIQPSLGPVFWDAIKGADDVTRVIQWTVSTGESDGQGYITLGANLNHGHTSRGRLTITPSLTVNVSTLPYFNDPGDHDFKALLTSTSALLDIAKNIPGAAASLPANETALEQYLRDAIRTATILTANHWTSSTRIGASCDDTSAVVDATTKVCGTDNLHVVDAGIINGVPSANPQAMIIVAAERAAEVILSLDSHD